MRHALLTAVSAAAASVTVTLGIHAFAPGFAGPGGIGSAAHAQDGKAAVELGPADALVLAGKPALRVSNADGRIAFGPDAGHRVHSIATIQVSKAMRALMESPRFAQERERLDDERKQKEEEFERLAKELRERIAKAGDEEDKDPKLGEDIEAFQRMVGEWGEGMERSQREMMARQYESAYGDLREAVEVVADRRRIDLVMRFVPPGEKLEPGAPDELARQLLARTFVRVPEALDITDEVMKELNVTEVKEKPE